MQDMASFHRVLLLVNLHVLCRILLLQADLLPQFKEQGLPSCLILKRHFGKDGALLFDISGQVLDLLL